jgi:hypothetical protein
MKLQLGGSSYCLAYAGQSYNADALRREAGYTAVKWKHQLNIPGLSLSVWPKMNIVFLFL